MKFVCSPENELATFSPRSLLMNDDKIVCKIAVIFVTDVVGFSKLMEK